MDDNDGNAFSGVTVFAIYKKEGGWDFVKKKKYVEKGIGRYE